MPGRVRLTPLETIWPDVTALAKEWREAIERSLSWSWGPGFDVHDGEGGKTVNYRPRPSAISAVVASGGITAASGDTLGEGNAVLRYRNGAALTNGPTVKVYSHFTTAIPVDTRIEVAPDGPDYKLVAAQYCPP